MSLYLLMNAFALSITLTDSTTIQISRRLLFHFEVSLYYPKNSGTHLFLLALNLIPLGQRFKRNV